MYLIDPLAGHVTVYEATIHGSWLEHSQHDLLGADSTPAR
jgi:hypothetical protein